MDVLVEELIERLGGSYNLVVAAAQRAEQLRNGAKPLVDTDSRNPLTIALEELAAGQIVLKPLDEAAVQDSDQPETHDYLERRGSIDELLGNAEEEG